MMKVKKEQEVPETLPEPSPLITPEMIKTTLEALESSGVIYYSEGKAYVPTETGWKFLARVSPVKEIIYAKGNENVLATDEEMIKVSRKAEVKDKATIAVNADKACKDLDEEFKNELKKAKKVEITIEAEGESEKIVAYGSPALKLKSANEIVIRKSSKIDNSTLAILADKSASEIKRSLIEKLRNSNTIVKITLEIKL